jgi:hypothetical protein
VHHVGKQKVTRIGEANLYIVIIDARERTKDCFTLAVSAFRRFAVVTANSGGEQGCNDLIPRGSAVHNEALISQIKSDVMHFGRPWSKAKHANVPL